MIGDSGIPALSTDAVALQRCGQFVGRTTNWLYDHLCHVPRYEPVVFCNELVNRNEFPKLTAWSVNPRSLTRRLWHRIAGDRLYPTDRRRVRSLAPRVFHSHFGDQAVEDLAVQKMLEI